MRHLGSNGRTLVVTSVVLVTGFLSLAQIFSDLGPQETQVSRILVTWLTLIFGAVLIGLIVPRRWYLAVLSAWGPFLLAGGGLLVAIRTGRIAQAFAGFVETFLIVPGILLLSAFAAAVMRQRPHRRMN